MIVKAPVTGSGFYPVIRSGVGNAGSNPAGGSKLCITKQKWKGDIMEKAVRPEKCREEHLEYLDGLRESGRVNMFGAAMYLRNFAEFDLMELTKTESRDILTYWMKTFEERHKK